MKTVNNEEGKGGCSDAMVTVATQPAPAVSAITIIQSYGPSYFLGRKLIKMLSFRRIGP